MTEMAAEEEGGGMHSEFDETEHEVCDILLNLGSLIAESERVSLEKQKDSELLREGGGRLQPFTVVWGAKKILVGSTRRNSSSSTTLASAETTASPSSQQVKVAKATSPDTPLSFSPSSVSDDNTSSPFQIKKKKEELLQTVEGLSECRELLTKEVDTVTNYHNKLLAYNKMLKEKKQMAASATCTSHEPVEKSNLEIKNSSNLAVRSGQLYQTAVKPPPHQGQFMVNLNPMAIAESQYQAPSRVVHGQVGPTMRIFAPSGVMGGRGVNQVGRLPHYNGSSNPKEGLAGLSLTQCQASPDYARACAESKARVRAAEARRYRKMMVNRQRQQMQMKLKLK